MNTKIIGLVAVIIIVCTGVAVAAYSQLGPASPTQTPTPTLTPTPTPTATPTSTPTPTPTSTITPTSTPTTIPTATPTATLTPTLPLDITVTGSSSCLRFLNDSVPMVYVPFTVAAGQHMQLTINATKMPGGAGGWVDVYLYKGYWNNGTDNTCVSGQVYSILSDIKAADKIVMANAPYSETFGEASQQSYTVFFLFPPGGQAQFHITLKPAE